MGPTPSENLFKQKIRINHSLFENKKRELRRNTLGTDIEKTKEIVKVIFEKPSKKKSENKNDQNLNVLQIDPKIQNNDEILEGGSSSKTSDLELSDFKDSQSLGSSSLKITLEESER